jgi:hypothetical protein
MKPQAIFALVLAGLSAAEIRAALRDEVFRPLLFSGWCEKAADCIAPSVHTLAAHQALMAASRAFRAMVEETEAAP